MTVQRKMPEIDSKSIEKKAGHMLKTIAASVCVVFSTGQLLGQVDDAAEAFNILNDNCYYCHGESGSAEGSVSYILDREQLIRKKKLIPGDAENSRIFIRVTAEQSKVHSKDDGKTDSVIRKGPMPPVSEGNPLSSEQIATLKRWIDGGAKPFPGETSPPRAFVSLTEVLQSIDAHLEGLTREDRPYQRYFSLRHLHNIEKVKNSDMQLYRAALSKLVNSLSWKPDIIVPQAIDQHETVFAIDLRDLDWDRHSLWRRLLVDYPYALKYNSYPNDEKLNELAASIYETLGTDVPVVRADWFIATASRPPLYHMFLRLPEHVAELDESLQVDVADNFRRNRAWRAGFIKSGVSTQNRLVERHSALYGAYWISYDFKPENERSNLYKFPLGPKADWNPHNRHAFDHDGGEIIFNLPNGLQAYMLIDATGNRINSGPLDVVRDRSEFSGSIKIVNGVSCMACHAHGMLTFEDKIRASHLLQGEAERKVEALYTRDEVMQKLVEKDSARFLRSLEQAIRPFLDQPDTEKKLITAYPEPVGKIAKWYKLGNLGLSEIAAELGQDDHDELQTAVKHNSRLRDLGLRPILNDATIKRESWESGRGLSMFQTVASELELGTPVIFSRSSQNR